MIHPVIIRIFGGCFEQKCIFKKLKINFFDHLIHNLLVVS